MSNVPQEPSFLKDQGRAASVAGGVFGLVWFAGWLAQILMPTAEEWKTILPAELLTPAGMTAFIVYIWTWIKNRLTFLGYWPNFLG